MSRTYVVSGAASGIGAATAAMLREQGGRVIGIDLRPGDGVDVAADLGTPEGRSAAVAGVQELTDVVHGLVPAAGLAGRTGVPGDLVVSVNFFGAVALVRGLHPQLAAAAERDGDAGVVFLASNSITGMPGWNVPTVEACLRDDEEAARREAAAVDSVMVYPSSKAGLAWWARREGVKPEWAGAGIRLNSVAPGATETARRPAAGQRHRRLPDGDRPHRPPRGGGRPDLLPALGRGDQHRRRVPVHRRRHRRDAAPHGAPGLGDRPGRPGVRPQQ